MKKLFTVLQFELMNYVQNKSYMVTTILLGVLLGALLFLPNFVDMSSVLGTGSEQSTENSEKNTENEKESPANEEARKMMLYDANGIIADSSFLSENFPNVEFLAAAGVEEIEAAVKNGEAEAGFVVKSYEEFDYYVFNQGMSGNNVEKFKSVLTALNRMNYCEINGLDYKELSDMYSSQVMVNEQILGKDTRANYWYCYALVILVFMMIILYGTMIATSVTAEKSNRSIEVLVTSTSPNSLLFGKVIAGAAASLFQAFFVLGMVLLSYQINREAWGGMLDMMLNIPASVLVTFGFFGLGGFLFYAFIYGAVGALVSKTEDISKSTGGVMMIIMIVYFVSLIQLGNPDGIAVKILSFLPFSSYSAMFARVAMGTVAMWEVVLSFVILVLSILGAGLLGAKIYRMGTLRYGNPIKISHALKSLRKGN